MVQLLQNCDGHSLCPSQSGWWGLLDPLIVTWLLHPVSAWNIGNARAFSGPKPAAISWAAKYMKLFPVSNANHISWLQCMCHRYGQHNDICVNRPDKNLVVAALCSMWSMQQHATCGARALQNVKYAATCDCLLLMVAPSSVRSSSGGLLWTPSPFVITSSFSFSSNHLRLFEFGTRIIPSCFHPRSNHYDNFLVWQLQLQHVCALLYHILILQWFLTNHSYTRWSRIAPPKLVAKNGMKIWLA